jgi:UrcA family protein
LDADPNSTEKETYYPRRSLMNTRIPTLLRFAAPILLAFSTSAWAADEQPKKPFTEHVTIIVDAAGIDLTTPAGVGRLHREIMVAAETACDGTPHGYKGVARRAYETQQVRPCIEAAVRGALEQVAAVTGSDLEQVAGLVRSADRIANPR